MIFFLWICILVLLQIHTLLQQLKDSDSESGSSVDVSNTDSGRGPSEDGRPIRADNEYQIELLRRGQTLIVAGYT